MRDQTQFEIEVKQLDALLVAGIRMKGKYRDIGKGFGRLGRSVGRWINGNPLCLYYDGEYRTDDADMEPCMPVSKSLDVDGVSIRELPATRCVSLLHQGPYDEISGSYTRVLDCVKEKGYEIILPTREVYLKGPGMIFRGNPKKYLTEIQIPIKS